MNFPASKGTTQITAPGVAGMGKEENPAMPAPGETGSKMGLRPQDGPQDEVVLQDETGHLLQPVPVRTELETLLDSYR
jgi:hypothetical protein